MKLLKEPVPELDNTMVEQFFFGVVGVMVGAVVTGIYNLRIRQRDFVNDYYKVVIDKRVVAYEKLSSLIVCLRTCVVDTDNKPYH